MGQALSATELVAYAGDLRRAAKQVPAPALAATLQRAATEIEKTGLAKAGVSPGVGALLDMFT